MPEATGIELDDFDLRAEGRTTDIAELLATGRIQEGQGRSQGRGGRAHDGGAGNGMEKAANAALEKYVRGLQMYVFLRIGV